MTTETNGSVLKVAPIDARHLQVASLWVKPRLAPIRDSHTSRS
jgi:hypothetical protein